MRSVTFEAEPTSLSVDLDRAALVIIDMQRDFLEPGGFGEALGNDVSRLQAAVGPCRQVHDQGAGRHFRFGRCIETAAHFVGRGSLIAARRELI